MPGRAPKAPSFDPELLADCIHDALTDALQDTNALLAALAGMMSCSRCHGTGQEAAGSTADARVTRRCACRDDAATLLDEMDERAAQGEESEDAYTDEEEDED